LAKTICDIVLLVLVLGPPGILWKPHHDVTKPFSKVLPRGTQSPLFTLDLSNPAPLQEFESALSAFEYFQKEAISLCKVNAGTSKCSAAQSNAEIAFDYLQRRMGLLTTAQAMKKHSAISVLPRSMNELYRTWRMR
jgi:hypothetical protein